MQPAGLRRGIRVDDCGSRISACRRNSLTEGTRAAYFSSLRQIRARRIDRSLRRRDRHHRGDPRIRSGVAARRPLDRERDHDLDVGRARNLQVRRDLPAHRHRFRHEAESALQGASINLEAATLLEIDGTKVAGRWEDKINSLGGIVRGDVTENGFEILLGGQFFQAKMAVAGSECAQQVTVSPERSSYFREFSADLRKC